MTAEEFLKNDNSYLIVPHHTTNIFSRAFWKEADDRNLNHKFAGSKGNQREAYEAGVKIGWQESAKTLERSLKVPNNTNLTDKEFKEIMALISAFGYRFIYIIPILIWEIQKIQFLGLIFVRIYLLLKLVQSYLRKLSKR